jgi:hypothetical protein
MDVRNHEPLFVTVRFARAIDNARLIGRNVEVADGVRTLRKQDRPRRSRREVYGEVLVPGEKPRYAVEPGREENELLAIGGKTLANMSPFATRLKVGTTALVLEAIVRSPDHPLPQLAEPVAALHSISRDPRFRWEVNLRDGTSSTALAVQRGYLAAVRQGCDLSAPAKAALVADWEQVLKDLETDFRRCRDRLDWVAKWALLREFQSAQGLADDDPWLQSLDLEYHRLDLAEGLYYAWEQTGAMIGVPDERAVQRAMVEPPATARAAIRGLCVQKFPAALRQPPANTRAHIRARLMRLLKGQPVRYFVDWEAIDAEGLPALVLQDPFAVAPTEAQAWEQQLRSSTASS